MTTSWTDFPPDNDLYFRDDTLSLYPPSPPTPVDPSLTDSVYSTQHTSHSFIVTISSLNVSWSIDDDNNNNQLINYYLRFTGSFISQHSPSIISNVTEEGNNVSIILLLVIISVPLCLDFYWSKYNSYYNIST